MSAVPRRLQEREERTDVDSEEGMQRIPLSDYRTDGGEA
jgi:hypothetical protein